MKRYLVKMSAVACLCTLGVGLCADSFADPLNYGTTMFALDAGSLPSFTKVDALSEPDSSFSVEKVAENIEEHIGSAKLDPTQADKIRTAVRDLTGDIRGILNEVESFRSNLLVHEGDQRCLDEFTVAKNFSDALGVNCSDAIKRLENGINADFKAYSDIEELIAGYQTQKMSLRGPKHKLEREQIDAEIVRLQESLKGTFSDEMFKNLKDEFYSSLKGAILGFLTPGKDGFSNLDFMNPNYSLWNRISGHNVTKNEVRKETLDFVKSLTEKYCAEDSQSLEAINTVLAQHELKSNSASRDVLALGATAVGGAFTSISHLLKDIVNNSFSQRILSAAAFVCPDAEVRPLLGQVSKFACYSAPAIWAATSVSAPLAAGAFVGTYFAESIGHWFSNFGRDLADPSKTLGSVLVSNAGAIANGVSARVGETVDNVKKAATSVCRKFGKACKWAASWFTGTEKEKKD